MRHGRRSAFVVVVYCARRAGFLCVCVYYITALILCAPYLPLYIPFVAVVLLFLVPLWRARVYPLALRFVITMNILLLRSFTGASFLVRACTLYLLRSFVRAAPVLNIACVFHWNKKTRRWRRARLERALRFGRRAARFYTAPPPHFLALSSPLHPHLPVPSHS